MLYEFSRQSRGVNMTASFGVGEGVNMTPSSEFGRLPGK